MLKPPNETYASKTSMSQSVMPRRDRECEDKEEPTSIAPKKRKLDSERRSLAHDAYTVGWVCALPKEQTAATAMLDQRHAELPKAPNDPNTYTLGSVGKHNVVIACLPKGQVGNNPAAVSAAWMSSTFPSIRIGLMVGIGGGVASKVRLGDVVVSTPVGEFPGVVQWDLGKAKDGGSFERTGSLNNPPTSLLTAISRLETEHELNGSKIPEYLDELKEKWPRLAHKYLKSDSLEDVLFKADYSHVSKSTASNVTSDDDEADEEENSCRSCDKTKIVKRKPRDMRVHFGLIASGNQVIKDACFRDKLNKDLGGHVLCVEMEAAGLMNNFPCIVVRGICDYADSHKNKDWQEHAAAVAAAFAKELLEYVQPSDVDGERMVKEILDQVLDTVSRTDANIKTIRSNFAKREDLEILDWLTAVDYGPQQSDNLRRRQSGTGQWLLDSAAYQTWLNAEKQALFCPGIPGAGKTILTAIVVDELCKKFQNDPSVGIAYIYCNFRKWEEQKAEHLLLSLLKQLLQERPSLPDDVKALYDYHNTKRTRPSFDEICKVLHSVATYSRIFIIVDALDECQVSDNCRTKFLSEISILQVKCGANIFATSRFVPEITERFEGSLSIEIRASDDDVRRYLDGHLSQFPAFVRRSVELQDEIKDAIVKAVDGMFLLAQLHLDSLIGMITPKSIRTALKMLPTGSDAYDYAYKDAMERIEGQRKEQKELAKQVISWITYTKRPLTTFELQHAIAVEVGTCELDRDNFSQIEDMVSVCAGLVTIDEANGVIRLVHYTTQEYFERTQKHWFPDAEADITSICVTYLSFGVFETGFCRTRDELSDRLESNRLFDYAARNWGWHARLSPIEGHVFILDFLQNNDKISACTQAMLGSKVYDRNYRETQMTGLHVSAYFGLVKSTAALLDRQCNPSLKDMHGKTPLHYATENGHQDVVTLLLNKDADPNSKDGRGQTPLHYLAETRYPELVKLLLDKNADPNIKDGRGRTLLHYVAENGHQEIAKLLLDKNAYPNTTVGRGRTPLHYAAENGHQEVVKLLLETNANPESKEVGNRRTPLHYAAENGHQLVVKLLLDMNVNPDSKDSGGRTPLRYAAENGHHLVVKLLLDMNADPNSKEDHDYTGGSRTPLHYAAENGHPLVVKLLLDKSANPDSKDGGGRTSLSYAAGNGHQVVVKLLLDKNVNPNEKDRGGRTPLHYATQNGNPLVVKLLLNKNADPNSKEDRDFGGDGRTPLHYAAENGHPEVVKLLLDKNADPDSKGGYRSSQTPLDYAAEKGHWEVVKLLLDKNADPHRSHYVSPRQTALHYAAENGHHEIVKLLLDKDAYPNIKGYWTSGSRTPLHYAAENGHQEVVKLLLDKNADPNMMGEITIGSRTPLHYAAENGHQGVVKLLLDKNADPNRKEDRFFGGDGRTPLHYAAENGHPEVVKLLLDKNADPNMMGEITIGSRTPLHYAAENGHQGVVKLLLDKNANPNVGGIQTPLSYAAENEHWEVVRLLLSRGAKF